MNKSNKGIQEPISTFIWILLIFITGFFLISPFHVALFNGNEINFNVLIYSFVTITTVFLGITSIYLLLNKNLFNITIILIWLIPISFFISIFNSASHHNATIGFLIQIANATLFMIGFILIRIEKINKLIQHLFLASGYIVVIYGLLNWYGYANYKHAVLGSVGSEGLRLTSVFQYANTYGAFLTVIFMCSLLIFIHSQNKKIIFYLSLMQVPVLVSLMLTVSRGAILVAGCLYIFSLFFFKISKQILSVYFLLVSGGFSVLIIKKVTSSGYSIQLGSEATFSDWGLLVLAAFACATIITFSKKYIDSLSEQVKRKFPSRFHFLILPFAFVILIMTSVILLMKSQSLQNLLPENIKNRISSLGSGDSSVSERMYLYNDFWGLFKDFPLFGVGSGGWGIIFEKYQSYPYIVRQLHNFYLQTIAEIGSFGFITIISIFLFILIKYILSWSRSKSSANLFYFFIALIFLIHSALDFDMSYVYISGLVFFSLGALVNEFDVDTVPKPETLEKRNYISIIFSCSLLLLSGYTAFYSLKMEQANKSFLVAQRNLATNSIDSIRGPLNKSLELAPFNPFSQNLSLQLQEQIYLQTKNQKQLQELEETVQKLRKKEPYNRSFFEALHNIYVYKQDMENVLELLDEGTQKYKWDISLYERYFSISFQIAEQARINKELDKMNDYFNKLLNKQNQVNQMINTIDSYNKDLQEQFKLTTNMALNLGQTYFIKGDYNSAINIMKPFTHLPLESKNVTILSRWYIASLTKLGQKHDEVYQKLITKDPNEITQIQRLVETNFLN